MPYAVIEKEMEGLDEAQQNAVIYSVASLWEVAIKQAFKKPCGGRRKE